MCLTIEPRKHAYVDQQYQHMKAIEDIQVWKVINYDNKSLHLYFQYKPNKLYSNVKFNFPFHYGFIEEGYHAYRTRSRARAEFDKFSVEIKLVKFIIPKGTKYYIGMNGDIVSERIRSGDLEHCR